MSHHGATGGGVRRPKMRHLVLYKLAGFFPADSHPLGGGLCPQKRRQKVHILCTFVQIWYAFRTENPYFGPFLGGGGATFWQPQKPPKYPFFGVALCEFRDREFGVTKFLFLASLQKSIIFHLTANKKIWFLFFICIHKIII